jgi:general L-amino acid transport system permease protein
MLTLRRLVYDARVRDIFWQVAICTALVALTVFFVRNASQNMVNAGIASGFDFLWRSAGIDVQFSLTGYKSSDTIWALFWTGVANTMFVSLIAMVLATLLGFLIGLARLSSHWLLAAIAGGYVEFVRNIPLLFFVLFWYFGVIAALPQPRDSLSLFSTIFLNNRGLTLPAAGSATPFQWALVAILVGILAQIVIARFAARRKAETGADTPTLAIGLVLCGLLPILALVGAASVTEWDFPQAGRFNLRGGFVIIPEFVALLGALVTYTAGFVAEIVRGGIAAVVKGQREAASSLGLRPGQVLRFIVIPQAMRVMIPPMTSQYLNVLKNSSFGATIAYPDIVSLFMGSALNDTGQAIEIIAMTLAVYLFFGLIVSALMNWYNARIALVTR